MAVKSLAPTADTRLIQGCDRVIEILLYLTFFLVPVFFTIYTRDQFELPKLTLLRMLTAVMLGAWAIRIVAARRLEFRRTPLDLPILVWFGLQILTSILSVSGYVSWLGEYENFRGLLTVGNYMVLYYLAVNFIRSRAQIDRLLFAVLLAGLVMTGYGISQFFGIDFIAWNPASISKGRYFSTLGNPNFLAAYLAMVMPLLVIFFIETQSRFRRALLFISFVSMFLCLMGTWSRGGFMGLLGALGALVLFGLLNVYRLYKAEANQRQMTLPALIGEQAGRHKIWVTLIVFTLALLTLISLTLGRNHMVRIANSVLHVHDTLKVSRMHIWGPAVAIFKTHPVLGTGLDTFKTVFPRYATTAFASIDGANVASRTAHNEILQVLATQGVIGLLIVTWLSVMILVNWWRAYRLRKESWRDRLILAGLLGTWLAYSIQNVFSFGVAAIDIFYWLLPALIVLFQSSPEEQTRQALSQTPNPQPAAWLASLYRARSLAYVAIVAGAIYFAGQALNVALADYAYNRATLYRMQGLWDKSLEDFTAAARMLPIEVKYVVYRGLAQEEKAKNTPDLQQQRQWIEQAIHSYLEGVRLNPTNAYYLGNLGRAYGFAAELDRSHTDYYDKSIYYFKQAVAQAPVTVLFHQSLGLTYLMHGDEQGFKSVQTQLATFDRPEAARLTFTAANQFYNLRQLELARAYYQQALAINPDYPEAYFNLGVTVAQLSGSAQALPYWRKALALKPDFEPAQQMLLRYQSGTGGKMNAGGDILNR